MGRRGRPTKLNREVIDRLLLAVRNGSTLETAAALAGVDQSTLFRWIQRGKMGQAPYAQFVVDLEQALAVAEIRDLTRIRRAAERGVWQAAAWHLERRWPERWAAVRKSVIRHEGVLRKSARVLAGRIWGIREEFGATNCDS